MASIAPPGGIDDNDQLLRELQKKSPLPFTPEGHTYYLWRRQEALFQ